MEGLAFDASGRFSAMVRHGSRIWIAAALVALGVVAAGCSSSSSSSLAAVTTSSVPTTSTTSAPAPVTLTSTTIDANGLVFDARAAGPADGELALLLHGFPQTSYEWRSQLMHLGKAGFHAVAPDQRGYSSGARPKGDSEYTIANMVADTVAIADELGAKRFHLVGHDWGAGVAWAVAIAHPDRVASLSVLSVPHPAAYALASQDPNGEQRSKQGYISAFVSPGAAATFGADIQGFLRVAFGGAVDESDVAEYAKVLGKPGALDAALAWYRANDLRGGLGDAAAPVATPTLFVYGTGDCCLGRDAADLTENYVTGPYQYEVLDGVSHWLPEVEPDKINALLLAHIQKFPAAK